MLNNNLTWSLDLLNTLWIGAFGVFFGFLILFHTVDKIKEWLDSRRAD